MPEFEGKLSGGNAINTLPPRITHFQSSDVEESLIFGFTKNNSSLRQPSQTGSKKII